MKAPLRFEPFLRPMVWGGRGLGTVLGKKLPASGPFGESWEISDHPSHRSALLDSPEPRTLRDLMERCRPDLLGPAAPTQEVFPWLVKFLDACDWLSVQVHPDAEAVKRLWPGEGSKTEAWFVLASRPESRVYAGLRPGVDERTLRQALAAGTVADCLHSFHPQPGDCLFLPAGTVHAVGGGVLMAEVQQTSDATFRLFDWNRRDAQGQSRKLHVEEALACINWNAGPVHPVAASGYPTRAGKPAGQAPHRQSLVRCPYFHLDYVRQAAPFAWGGTGRLQVHVVVHGKGRLETSSGSPDLAPGDTLLLPASMAPVLCHPHGSLGILAATLP